MRILEELLSEIESDDVSDYLNTIQGAKKQNIIKLIESYNSKEVMLASYPIILTIDPNNTCNLECRLCPTGQMQPGRIRGNMKMDIYKKIIDECGKYLMLLYLYNWGEPLLNKNIFEMIDYADKYNMFINLSSNLNYYNKDISKMMIDSRLYKIIISLHGASKETVNKYQKNSDFKTVLKNIDDLVRIRGNSKNPKIYWRPVINVNNESEIGDMIRIAKDKGIDRLELGSIRCDMDKELECDNLAQFSLIKKWLPRNHGYSIYDYKNKVKKIIKKTCNKMWFESVINPCGGVTPCCAVWDSKYDFGNITNEAFLSVWNNTKYQDTRGDNTRGTICSMCIKNKAII